MKSKDRGILTLFLGHSEDVTFNGTVLRDGLVGPGFFRMPRSPQAVHWLDMFRVAEGLPIR